MDINQFKLMALFSKLFGGNPTPREIGGGTQRAQARLEEKRKRNKEIYGDLPAAPPSRQVLRAEARRAAKDHRSGVKQATMREGWKGGAVVAR